MSENWKEVLVFEVEQYDRVKVAGRTGTVVYISGGLVGVVFDEDKDRLTLGLGEWRALRAKFWRKTDDSAS